MAANVPPTVWSNAVLPGGQVCAVPTHDNPDGICGMPVESEPCREHTRCTKCNHGGDDHDAGECWVKTDGEQCPCGWYTPAYEEAAR
jgi:hypothetical protein